MKKNWLGTLLFAGLILAPMAAMADHHDWNHAKWDAWAHGHRDIAVEVQAHPEYLQNRAWVHRHHDLEVYLQSDPHVATYYTANPYPVIEVQHAHTAHWHRYEDHHWGY